MTREETKLFILAQSAAMTKEELKKWQAKNAWQLKPLSEDEIKEYRKGKE